MFGDLKLSAWRTCILIGTWYLKKANTAKKVIHTKQKKSGSLSETTCHKEALFLQDSSLISSSSPALIVLLSAIAGIRDDTREEGVFCTLKMKILSLSRSLAAATSFVYFPSKWRRFFSAKRLLILCFVSSAASHFPGSTWVECIISRERERKRERERERENKSKWDIHTSSKIWKERNGIVTPLEKTNGMGFFAVFYALFFFAQDK